MFGKKTIKIKYHNADLIRIEPIAIGDWIDLRSAEHLTLKSGDFAMINLGVSMKLPKGYEAHVAPRSSTFKNFGVIVSNSFGIIDNSYCGNEDIWRLPVIAIRDTEINVNDRICQFRILKKQPVIQFEEVNQLNDENRGGFGSTGVQ